jgi:hypothetical protein
MKRGWNEFPKIGVKRHRDTRFFETFPTAAWLVKV